jgi:hypothetical protein
LKDGSSAFARGNQGIDLDLEMGRLLVEILKYMRDTGKFSELQAASRCQLCVESPEGNFGWPAYEDAGKENLL